MVPVVSDRSVFTEPDSRRLQRRLAAVTGGDLTSPQVEKLAAGALELIEDLPPSAQHKVAALVAPAQQDALERILGGAIPDYVPIAYLDLARRAARAVGRIVDDRRRPQGTGFMVSPQLFMTNHHVVGDAATVAGWSIQFDYQLDTDGMPDAVTEYGFDPSTFFLTSPDDELDMTLVAVGARFTGARPLSDFGWLPLSAATDKHAEGDFVSIVQHPDGDFKQIGLRENRLIGRGRKGTTLFYDTDTMHGASGSPVFNDQFDVVALHHAGEPYNDKQLEDGSAVTSECNEGIRISAIVAMLRARHDELPEIYREVLAAALNPPPIPPTALTPVDSSSTESMVNPGVAQPGAVPPIAGAVSAELTLPVLRIADRLPTGTMNGQRPAAAGVEPAVVPAPVAPLEPASSGAEILERNDPPDPHYSARRGYDPEFLATAVPVPRIPRVLLAKCALPEGEKRRSATSVLIPYLHFGLVMHAERKLPLFTAVNIDGRLLRTINRRTGAVEAAETWYTDPRIVDDEQTSQELYQNQRPRIFDRGHLVRRLDPAWGSPETAKAAADDTFHFTNCCPQISRFNQHLWQGIENYALTNAGAQKKRITVFTGPILTDDDPLYRDVAVPRAFWKIVVRMHRGELRATAFLADQGEAVDAALAPVPTESFTEPGRVAMFQTTIVEVERRTGLVWETLRAVDTANVGLESVAELDGIDGASW